MTVLRPISPAAGLLLSLGAAAQTPAKPAKPVDPAAAQLRPASVPLAATDDSRREARALGDLLLFPDRARVTVAQMHTFFASPVDQRWIQSMPSVERDSQRQIQVLGQDVFRDAVSRPAAALHEHGVNF